MILKPDYLSSSYSSVHSYPYLKPLSLSSQADRALIISIQIKLHQLIVVLVISLFLTLAT
jgi:hypothetical protein